MKIIDMHAHIYPDKIAEKASLAIERFYDLPMDHDGTLSSLLAAGDRAGVDMTAVHSVATDPGQVRSINDFIARAVGEHPGRLIGFATLHPQDSRIREEADRAIGLGLKGVKIHPDFQKFNIDSQGAFKIYEAIEGRLPILIHTGDYRYEYSKPQRVLNVLKRFPGLKVICAHFGGWSEWGDASKILAGQGVFVDTSSSLYALTDGQARDLIRTFGSERVLFGSDYPMWDPGNDIARLKNMGLAKGEMEKIFHENAEKLLGL